MVCEICFIMFNSDDKKPLILNCGHTYCSSCLAQIRKNDKIECPLDRK